MFASLLNKLARFQTCSFIKKILQHRCFPVNFLKFFKNSDFKKHQLAVFILRRIRLSKEIMKRTTPRNKFLKERTDESKKRYALQRHYCVSLLKKTKKNYYDSLNEKDVSDNKTFWKTVKPFLSDKIQKSKSC